jgi:hypothetical protein
MLFSYIYNEGCPQLQEDFPPHHIDMSFLPTTKYVVWEYFLLCWVGVHCGIYKSSYNVSNISYLNWLAPPFSFIPPWPYSWNRYHFYIYIHVYTFWTIFIVLCHFPATTASHWYHHPFRAGSISPYFRKKMNKRCFLDFGHAKLVAKISQIRWQTGKDACEWSNVTWEVMLARRCNGTSLFSQ